jgi:hypothetical protein
MIGHVSVFAAALAAAAAAALSFPSSTASDRRAPAEQQRTSTVRALAVAPTPARNHLDLDARHVFSPR